MQLAQRLGAVAGPMAYNLFWSSDNTGFELALAGGGLNTFVFLTNAVVLVVIYSLAGTDPTDNDDDDEDEDEEAVAHKMTALTARTDRTDTSVRCRMMVAIHTPRCP